MCVCLCVFGGEGVRVYVRESFLEELHDETKQDPAGNPGDVPSRVSHFLFLGNVYPPRPRFQRANLIREVRKCRNKGQQSRRQNSNSLAKNKVRDLQFLHKVYR